MIKATVTPEDGRWRLTIEDWVTDYADLEEAVEVARKTLRSSGGGTIHLLDRRGGRDRILVPDAPRPVPPAQPPAAGPVTAPASEDATSAPAPPEPVIEPRSKGGGTLSPEEQPLPGRAATPQSPTSAPAASRPSPVASEPVTPLEPLPGNPVTDAVPAASEAAWVTSSGGPPTSSTSSISPAGKPPGDLVEDVLRAEADRALEAGLRGLWSRADGGQRTAVWALAGAAAIGPLGQGFLGLAEVLFEGAKLPSGDQIKAVGLLLALTLPVAAWIFVAVLLVGRAGGPQILILAGAAAYFAGVGMAEIRLPEDLGNLYCYADLTSSGIRYESACREFDALGFVSHTYDKVGSPSGSPEILQWALVYTADVRGTVMVVASIVAAFSLSYLIRRGLAGP